MTTALPPLKVLLAAPRGFCAGVERAIKAVEDAIEHTKRPVYVRHQIVHNGQVVRQLEDKGAVFVDELSDIPNGAVAIFSAHGVSRMVEEEAAGRKLDVLDATCPLVRRVHMEARRHVQAGRELILIGHRDHVEVEGILGQVDGTVQVIFGPDEVEALEISDPNDVAYVTQTTLSVDDTRQVIAALRARFPAIQGPDTKTICYATHNRQLAVKVIAQHADRFIVCGARNSSNTNRLCEVAAKSGLPALLMQRPSDLTLSFVDGAAVIGLTSGASAPEEMIRQALEQLSLWRSVTVEEVRVTEEGTRFAPVDLSKFSAHLESAS